MTDRSKCAGVGCPIRDGCDRFVRSAVDGQRWINSFFRFYCAEDHQCLDYQPIPVQPHGGAREEGDGA